MAKDIHVILNAAAGRAGDPDVPLALRGGVRFHRPQNPQDVRALAHDLGQAGHITVACGGDGTVRDVAAGLHGTAGTLGVLPLGTVNLFARENGVPLKDRAGAWNVIAAGHTRAWHAGRFGDELFLCCLGAGLDALACAEVDLGLKSRVGRLAYWKSFLEAWERRGDPLCRIVKGPAPGAYAQVLALLTRCYAGPFPVAPLRVPGDGTLDLFGAASVNASLVASALAGEWAPLARSHRAPRGAIVLDTPGGVELDGDHVALSAGDLWVDPMPLRVLALKA